MAAEAEGICKQNATELYESEGKEGNSNKRTNQLYKRTNLVPMWIIQDWVQLEVRLMSCTDEGILAARRVGGWG